MSSCALGADDGELATGLLLVAERRDDAGAESSWSWWVLRPRSHAAVRLGKTGDVRHLLGRLLGEQHELLLGGDAADGLDPPWSSPSRPCSVKSARRKRSTAQCASVRSMPMLAASTLARSSSHSSYSVRKPSSSTWTSWPLMVVTGMVDDLLSFGRRMTGSGRAGHVSAGSCLPAMVMCDGSSGTGRPGSSTFQYIQRKASLP